MYVAEYYKVEEVSEQIRIYKDFNGKEESLRPEELDKEEEMLAMIGIEMD